MAAARCSRPSFAQIKIPEFKTHNNGQVQEHIDLLESIVKGQPLNGARTVAESTLTAIMGRIAAYTGQVVRWSDLTTNTQSPWYNLALSPSPPILKAAKWSPPRTTSVPFPARPDTVSLY